MAASNVKACVYKDKECTQPISLSEMDEMFLSRPLIIYYESVNGGQTIINYLTITKYYHAYENNVEVGCLDTTYNGLSLYTSECLAIEGTS